MNINVNRSTERAGRHLRSLVVLPAVTVMVFVAAGTYATARQSRRTVWDGIYNEAQATRGKQLYTGNCSACHQESLQGADLAPALKGDSFVLRWSDSSVDDMVTAISASMPFDAPGSLAAQQYPRHRDVSVERKQVSGRQRGDQGGPGCAEDDRHHEGKRREIALLFTNHRDTVTLVTLTRLKQRSIRVRRMKVSVSLSSLWFVS